MTRHLQGSFLFEARSSRPSSRQPLHDTFGFPLTQTLLFLFLAFPSMAQWSTDPAVNSPVCTIFNDQTLPESVSDGAGGAIVVWRDDRSGSTNGNIFAQRLNAAGVPQWALNGVAICTAPNSQTYPVIVADGVGGAIIAWHDPRTSIFNNDIYAQRVDASGAVLWTANGVAISTASDHQSFARIATDGASGAIITWIDQRSVINGELYGQRISAGGVVQWATDGLPIRTGFQGFAPDQMIPDGAGGAIISWYDPLGTGGPDPFVQRINASGILQWGATGVNVCPVLGSQYLTALVSDGANGVIISWLDSRSGLVDVYAQRVNSSGAAQWTANGVLVCGAADNQDNLHAVADGSGGAIMAWTDLRSGTQYDIYAQRVNASGVMQWTVDGVAITSLPTNQFVPRMLPDLAGGSLIAWTDGRNGSPDIYAQRLDGNGNRQWAANGVAISTAPNSQTGITLVSDGSSGMIICWEDDRGGNYDIYTQRIPASGSLCFPPMTPATISGPTSAASGSNQVYSVTNDPTATSYVWSLPSGWTGTSTTNTINVVTGSSGGSLSVTASNACGPSSPSTIVISVVPSPHSILSFTPAAGAVGTTVVLAGVNFDSTPANNIVSFNGTSATVSASTSTSLTTQVPEGATSGPIAVTISGVAASSPTDFTVTSGLIIYNAISANGDTLNELLRIEGIDLTLISRIVIFDRLGRIVFDRTSYDNATNAFRGLSGDGKELPTGTYYYTLQFSNGMPKQTGFIALRR